MDILIIGAGAAGLYAATLLSRQGKKITVLEARNRTGGRIHTINDPSFELPVELGAEFIHGDQKLTIKLLKEAGIEHYYAEGDLWRNNNGALEEQTDFVEDEKDLLQKLKSLKEDMSVNAFLDTYFAGAEYEDLRKSLTSFVEGYDAADAREASCYALLQELLGEEGRQGRVKGGYGKLVDYLANECRRSGCEIHLSTIVNSITWRAGEATVTTANNKTFTAPKVILTVPISILQLNQIRIEPLPPAVEESIQSLGNTGVIKFILQFKDAFWNDAVKEKTGRKQQVGFLFADTFVPTWWTQLPEENGMITGWLAGTASLRHKDESEDVLLENALASLAKALSLDTATVRSKLISSHIINWTNIPFTCGAYAYEKVSSKHSKRILNTPLANTLFFAGEAYYEGPQRGTVEAALLSAEKVVELVGKA